MDRPVVTSLPVLVLERARTLRRHMTDAELRLWSRLRGRQLDGMKFRRQHPIPPCIVDFYCDARKLVVELDGSQHDEVVDRRRTGFLQRRGLTVLRFWNNEVLLQTQAVLEVIMAAARSLPLTPTPLPPGEGL